MRNELYLIPIHTQMISLGCIDIYTPEKLDIHSVKNLNTILIMDISKIAFHNRFLLKLDENPDKYIYKFQSGVNGYLYIWIRNSNLDENNYELNIMIEG